MSFLKSLNACWSRARVFSRSASKAILGSIGNAAMTVAEPIGFREILLFGGAALLAVGMWSVYPPASFLIPGAILVYVSIFGTA